MELEAVLGMLRDAEVELDIDAVTVCLETEHKAAEKAQGEVEALEGLLDEVCALVELEAGTHSDRLVEAVKAALSETDEKASKELKQLRKQVTALQQKVDAQQETLDARRQKLVDEIVGLMEVLRRGEDVIARFKTRAEKLSFEELDAEKEEQLERYRAVYRLPRATREGESEARQELEWRDLRGYRV